MKLISSVILFAGFFQANGSPKVHAAVTDIVATTSRQLAQQRRQQHHQQQQHLLQVDTGDVDLSEQCVAGGQAFSDDDAFLSALETFSIAQATCIEGASNTVVENIESSFAELLDGNARFSFPPCNDGIEVFEPICERVGGDVCQLQGSFDITGSVDLGSGEPTSFGFAMDFGITTCLPSTCTLDDYNAILGALNELGVIPADIPTVDFTIEVDFQIYCTGEDGLPAQFGSGTATEATITGNVTAATTFVLACSDCSPAWSVEFSVTAGADAEAIGNAAVIALNAVEAYEQSGCLTAYKVTDNSLNVFCPLDNAGTITLAANGDAAQPLTEFEGAGVQADGEQLNFETAVTRSNGALLSRTPMSIAGALALSAAVVFNQ